MPLRNGKKYLTDHLCTCKNFYSNKEFDYKCSECFDFLTKNGIVSCKEFSDKCTEWAENNTIDKIGHDFLLKNKHISDQHLLNLLLCILTNTGKYITAKIGLELFKARRTNRRGHIIGSFIADWWNIKSSNASTGQKWPSYLDCYYGNYSEDMDKWPGKKNTVPPHKPIGPNGHFNNDIICNLNLNLF
tara:strand:+ start:596 stop:1159 length:564 start_codon:yes stop_codon:yes gene_type:complete